MTVSTFDDPDDNWQLEQGESMASDNESLFNDPFLEDQFEAAALLDCSADRVQHLSLINDKMDTEHARGSVSNNTCASVGKVPLFDLPHSR